MKFLKIKTISSFLVINLSRITAITNTSSGISKSVITTDEEKYFSIETPEEIHDKIQRTIKKLIMRSNLELWEIVRDNFDSYWDGKNIDGLCMLLYKMPLNIITKDEWSILNDELCDEKSKLNTSKAYWLGEKGDPKPRKEFIEKMIKKHKNIL